MFLKNRLGLNHSIPVNVIAKVKMKDILIAQKIAKKLKTQKPKIHVNKLVS